MKMKKKMEKGKEKEKLYMEQKVFEICEIWLLRIKSIKI